MNVKRKTVALVNVCTQNDFIDVNSLVYIDGSEKYLEAWEFMTDYAKKRGLKTLNFMRVNQNDFCVQGSLGVQFIPEVNKYMTENVVILPQERIDYQTIQTKGKDKNIIVHFNERPFNNENISTLLEILKIDVVYLYGLTVEDELNDIVNKLVKRKIEVRVVSDAIVEKDPEKFSDIINNWVSHGVKLVKTLGLSIK